MKKPLGTAAKVVIGFFSFLLCVILFVSILATILVADVRVLTQKDNLQKIISQTLFTSAVSRQPQIVGVGSGNPAAVRPGSAAKLSAPTARLDDAAPDAGNTAAIVGWVYDALKEQYGDQIPFTQEEVQEFVDESTLSDFIAEKSASIISDIYTGENTTTLTQEEIIEQIQQNAELIEEHFGFEVTEEVIQQVSTVIEENEIIEQIQEEGVANVIMGVLNGKPQFTPDHMEGQGPSDDGMGDSSNTIGMPSLDPSNPAAMIMELLNLFRSVTSTATLLTLVGICVALMGLICLLNMRQIWVGIIDCGVTALLSSLLFALTSGYALLMPDSWLQLLSAIPMAGPVSLLVLQLTAPVAFGVFGLGIVLIVGGCIIRGVVRKKRKAAEAAAAEAAALPETPEEAPAEEPPVEETPVEEAPAEEDVPAEPTAEAEETPAETADPV